MLTTHQVHSTSRKDSPVSDAPTTTTWAVTMTFGSRVNFLLMRHRANGVCREERKEEEEEVTGKSSLQRGTVNTCKYSAT